MKTIVLIAQRTVWEQAQAKGEYTQSTITSALPEVGFIHATFPDQTMEVLPRFKDRDDVVLLLVDADKVTVPIKYEAALSGRPGTFPHIYGTLNTNAVYKVVPLAKDKNGDFIEPELCVFDLQNFLATHQPKNGRFFTIAIDGRGGSGKTSFAELLKANLSGFTLLNGDDYFEPINDPIVWGEFNDKRFAGDVIEPLKAGDSFIYRPYDWHAEPHITEQKLEIAKGFCMERCHSFLFDLDWDLKIWIETPKETCLERGLVRENMPREKTIPAWKVWQRREDKYIRDFQPQEKADVIINGTRPFEGQI